MAFQAQMNGKTVSWCLHHDRGEGRTHGPFQSMNANVNLWDPISPTNIYNHIYIEILKTTHTCINRKTPTGRVYVLWADSPRRGISRCWTLAGCLGGSARRFFTNDILQAQFPFQDMPGVSISNFYPCKITRLKRQSHIFGFNNRHFEL
jgi:hypothetical protein